jgi:magnesium transporter
MRASPAIFKHAAARIQEEYPVNDETSKHPADLADELLRLPPEQAAQIIHDLPPEQAAAVLGEVEPEQTRELLSNLSPRELTEVVEQMRHDQAADMLGELPEAERREVLRELPEAPRQQVTDLLRYPAETAGGIMSDRFLTLQADETVEACLRRLRALTDEADPQAVTYLYVVDREQRLVGVVPLRQLVFGRPDRRLSEVMNRDVAHVWVDDDQEKIARLFERYHYMGLPVLEREGRLVGIVLAHQVIDVIQDEATEDMQLMVGLSGEERVLTPWKTSLARRLPWLCINLATAFLAGAVVGMFERTIAAWSALAIFLPIVAGQGGNAGVQTLTVIIRDMALGELSPGDGRRALFKETLLGLLNGLVIGLIVALVSYLWKGSSLLGLVVGIAMLLNMLAAALAGVLVPYTLRALKIDPAMASSILVTTVTDVAGFFFFLGLAALARG